MDEFSPATTNVAPTVGFTREPLPGGELPDIFKLVDETLKEFMADLGPYAMAGLGQFVIVVPVVIVGIIGVYTAIFGGIFGGAAVLGVIAYLLPESLGGLVVSIGSLGLPLVVIVLAAVMMVGMVAILMPTAASMSRAVARHQRGEEGALGFSSAFDSITQDIGAVMLAGVIVTALSVIGALMCYLPAFAVVLFLGFAMQLVSLHRVGAVGAMGMAFAHAREHLKWHASFSVVYFLMIMVAGNIPVIGPMFAVAFHVRAYRTLFGDGEAPVLQIAG